MCPCGSNQVTTSYYIFRSLGLGRFRMVSSWFPPPNLSRVCDPEMIQWLWMSESGHPGASESMNCWSLSGPNELGFLKIHPVHSEASWSSEKFFSEPWHPPNHVSSTESTLRDRQYSKSLWSTESLSFHCTSSGRRRSKTLARRDGSSVSWMPYLSFA